MGQIVNDMAKRSRAYSLKMQSRYKSQIVNGIVKG